jgi:hypothetical protein
MAVRPAPSYWPPCMSCGKATDPDSTLVLREVVGFTVHRSQGGANRIIERRETGRLLCPNCGKRMQHTGSPRQTDLVSALQHGPEQAPPPRRPEPIAEWVWLA